MCMALQKQFLALFVTSLLQTSIMNCCSVNRRAPSPCGGHANNLIAWHVHGMDQRCRSLEESKANRWADQPCLLCDVKIGGPAFWGSMSQPPAKKHSTRVGRAHAGPAACVGRPFPDQSGRMGSSTPGLPGHPLCIDRASRGPRGRRLQDEWSMTLLLAGYLLRLLCRRRFFWFWTLLEHDGACRSCVCVGLRCAFGFWPDCCFFFQHDAQIDNNILIRFLCLFSSPTRTRTGLLQQQWIVFLNFLFFFPLSNEATECGCFKEHSEVKKEALGKLYWKREETAQVWREEKKESMPMPGGTWWGTSSCPTQWASELIANF